MYARPTERSHADRLAAILAGMAEENAEVIREMLNAFSRGDVDGVLARFDPRCELREPPEMVETAAYHGHDGIRAWMANLRQVGAIVFEPVRFSGSGDVVVCEVAGRGRGQASGAPFHWSTWAVFEMRDARIVRLQAFLTQEEARNAAGSIVERPQPRPGGAASSA